MAHTQTLNSIETERTKLIQIFQPTTRTTTKKREFKKVIHDDGHLKLRFNIMKDRPVEENFYIKEYRIAHRYGEATLDRNYFSSMDKSPDHLIFFTGCAHSQKLFYLLLLEEFGYEYQAADSEKLKIWPFAVRVEMPRMVRDNENVLQKMWITKFEEIKPKVFRADFKTSYNNGLIIEADCKVYLI